jgi:hypothetical protein
MLSLDSRRFQRDMRELGEKKVRRATVFALTDSATDVHDLVVERMTRRFDRPTPFTLRSFRVKRADVREADPTATVLQKDAVGGRHWVATQEEGGVRPQTALERRLSAALGPSARLRSVLPGPAAKLDRFGNWSRADRNKALNAVGLGGTAAPGAPPTPAARGAQLAYFLARPGGRLSPGIWARARDGSLSKLAHFTDRPARYRARLGLLDGASQVFSEAFPRHFRRILDRMLNQQRGGGGTP